MTKIEFFKKNLTKILLFIFMVSLIGIAFWFKKNGFFSDDKFIEFLNKHETLAPIVFILIYPLMLALFIPTLPLNIAAGFLWGPLYGTIYSMAGVSIGISIDFFIARYIGRDFFTQKFNFKAWKWILNQVDTKGWKVVAFIRINPVFPANIFSYLFGITSISFKEYFIASIIAISIPATIFASLGSSAREFFVIGNIKGMIVGVMIALVGAVLLFAIRPKVNKMIENTDAVSPRKS